MYLSNSIQSANVDTFASRTISCWKYSSSSEGSEASTLKERRERLFKFRSIDTLCPPTSNTKREVACLALSETLCAKIRRSFPVNSVTSKLANPRSVGLLKIGIS